MDINRLEIPTTISQEDNSMVRTIKIRGSNCKIRTIRITYISEEKRGLGIMYLTYVVMVEPLRYPPELKSAARIIESKLRGRYITFLR